MDREDCLALVRTLTEQVMGAAAPEKVADFADDFADFALSAGLPLASERLAYPQPQGQGLETTLVAGMFFEVLMAAARLPAGPQERVSFVRKRAKDYLVTHLSGQITLSQFYRLLNLIEARVGDYFEYLMVGWTAAPGPPQAREAAPPTPVPLKTAAIDAEALQAALARFSPHLQGRRKLTPETLGDFLRQTGGGWFKLLDFEEQFQVNKKTAWTYLSLLLAEGILEHNGEKANRVRYALAPPIRVEPA